MISWILPAGHPSFGVYKRMPGTPLSLPNCLHRRVHEETVIVVEREGRSSHRRRPVRSLPAGFHGGVKENRPNLGNMFGGLPTVGDRWSAGKFLAVDLPPPSNRIASWSSHLGTFRWLDIPLSGLVWSYFLFASCFSQNSAPGCNRVLHRRGRHCGCQTSTWPHMLDVRDSVGIVEPKRNAENQWPWYREGGRGPPIQDAATQRAAMSRDRSVLHTTPQEVRNQPTIQF